MERQNDVLGALRAGWWIIPVVLAAALGGVATFTAAEPPTSYETAATLAAVPHHTLESENQILRSVEILERRTMVATLSRIPTSRSVLRTAAERLEKRLEDLSDYRVRTSVTPSTHLIRVTVRGPDPVVVSRYATEVIRAAAGNASEYYPVFGLRILEGPDGPGQPIERRTTRYYAVAGLVGLFLGVAGAWGVGTLRTARIGLTADRARTHPKPASQEFA